MWGLEPQSEATATKGTTRIVDEPHQQGTSTVQPFLRLGCCRTTGRDGYPPCLHHLLVTKTTSNLLFRGSQVSPTSLYAAARRSETRTLSLAFKL